MGRWERCFLCAVILVPERGTWVRVRTSVPKWVTEKVCPPCARKLADLEEVLVVKDGEWWTVRLDAQGVKT